MEWTDVEGIARLFTVRDFSPLLFSIVDGIWMELSHGPMAIISLCTTRWKLFRAHNCQVCEGTIMIYESYTVTAMKI